MRRLPLVAALSAVAALLWGEPSHARVSERSAYTKTQTYSASLRFLRVDRGFTIVEKDPDASYLIFDYQTSEGSEVTSHGSVEVIALEEGVRLVVTLPRLPEYHERVLSDGILSKLRREYGDPPQRKPRDKDDEDPDSDKDKGGPDKDKRSRASGATSQS